MKGSAGSAALNRESLNAIVRSSHQTVPASELNRCSASTWLGVGLGLGLGLG